MMNDFLSTTEVAKKTKLTRSRIVQLCNDKSFRSKFAKKFGGIWWIKNSAVDYIKDRPENRGRKAKKKGNGAEM